DSGSTTHCRFSTRRAFARCAPSLLTRLVSISPEPISASVDFAFNGSRSAAAPPRSSHDLPFRWQKIRCFAHLVSSPWRGWKRALVRRFVALSRGQDLRHTRSPWTWRIEGATTFIHLRDGIVRQGAHRSREAGASSRHGTLA